MGYNTVCVLLNDHMHEIGKDGPLGKRIASAMRAYPSAGRERLDLWFGVGSVISQDHADGEQVVIVSRNSGLRCDDANDLGWQALEQMKRALERHGYSVSKKRKFKLLEEQS